MSDGELHLLVERQTRLLSLSSDQLVRAYMTPLSLGLYFSCFFYGMFLIAAFLYFTQFKSDTWVNRGVITLLLCLTTADTIAGAVRVFRMTVVTPNNLTYVLDVTQRPEDWLCTVMLLLTVLTSQLFMSYRIIAFARHMQDWDGKHARAKMWAMIIALAVGWGLCLAACVANMVVFYQVTNYMQLLVPTQRLARMFQMTAVIMPCVLFMMDVLIAIFMSVQYGKAKTGFGVSNHILTKLVTVVIRNGIMIAAVMLTQLLTTVLAVLWANFMPMFYGKLHALTVVCILTEPRVAKSRWYKSQESDPSTIPSGPDGAAREREVKTPHMDYTRPSQYGDSLAPPTGSHTSNTAIKPKQYSPAFPACAHCHAPWLPSDMDTELDANGQPVASASASATASRTSGSGTVGGSVRQRGSAGLHYNHYNPAARALPSSQGSGWTDQVDAPYTIEVSPALVSSTERGSGEGDYFGADEKGVKGKILGKGTLFVEEEDEGGGELVAVLSKNGGKEAKGMSFAEALFDLEGKEEEEEAEDRAKVSRNAKVSKSSKRR